MWSKLHLIVFIPTFIVMILLAFYIGKKLKYKEERIKLIPLKIISILLVILELCKQIVSLTRGYDLFHLPFHYCSLFLYLLPIYSFYKGMHKNFFNGLTISACMSLFLVMIIYPTSIYGDGLLSEFFIDYLCFNSVMFHFLVCFYFFCMVSLGFVKFNTKKDIKNIIVLLLAYLIIISIISQLLDTNFHGMRYCIVDFIDDLRLLLIDSIGFFGQIIYICGVIFVSITFTIISYFLLKLIIKKDNKKG